MQIENIKGSGVVEKKKERERKKVLKIEYKIIFQN